MDKQSSNNPKREKRAPAQQAKHMPRAYSSATHYALAALVPYTNANLKLSFSPGTFFNDLEKIDAAKQKRKYQQDTLKTAYYRAVKAGLIEVNNDIPTLTRKGERKLHTFQPAVLSGDARLLVVFDIPESDRWKRTRLRTVLREFHFTQIQKSVWETKYDCRKYLETAITEYDLQNNVILYEASRIQQ